MARRRSLSGLTAFTLLAGTLLVTACAEDRNTGSTAPGTASSAGTRTATNAPGGGTSTETRPAGTTGTGTGTGAGTGTGSGTSGTRPTRAPRADPTGATAPRAALDGDVDGDGRADALAVPQPGVLHITYTGGGEETVRYRTGDPAFVDVRLLGASDADRDGHAEVFLEVDQGASFHVATIFRYVDGHLQVVTTEDGEQVALSFGGSTGSIATWACRPATVPAAAIVVASGPSTAPDTYRLDVSYFRFERAGLLLVSKDTAGPDSLDRLPAVRDGVSGASGCGQARLTP